MASDVVGYDLLGRQLTAAESELLDVYKRLRRLVSADELAPCAVANLKSALAACWCAVNDLALDYEQLVEF